MVLTRLISDALVDEDFETERVIVDLRKGHYFCINGSGSWLWQTLLKGPLCLPTLSQSLAEKHSLSQPQVLASLETWATVLEKSHLVQTGENPETAPYPIVESELPGDWSSPTVTVYGDLEHLLALDPIHDVDEQAGWPQQRAEPALEPGSLSENSASAA